MQKPIFSNEPPIEAPSAPCKLKVKNILQESLTQSDLEQLFASFGKLRECYLEFDNDGKFLGSATVEYEDADCAQQALEEYNGALLDDRELIIEYDIS